MEIFVVNVGQYLIHSHADLAVPFCINGRIALVDVVFVTVPCELDVIGEIDIDKIAGVFAGLVVYPVFPAGLQRGRGPHCRRRGALTLEQSRGGSVKPAIFYRGYDEV